MRGRPHRPRSPRRPLRRLPQLLLLLAVVVASAIVEAGWSHIPDSALQLLRSREPTLPADTYRFDSISTGQQRYPAHVRYATLKGLSLCGCRNRCLTEPRCMGFEHEEESRTCGLTDILLPADIADETIGGWSTGRRRSISWLGAPCHADSDCFLLVMGAECGPENICACQRGWTPLDEMLCRPDDHWVTLPNASLTGDSLDTHMVLSLQSCRGKCRDSEDCWAVEYNKNHKKCWLYNSSDQSGGDPLPVGTTAYENRLGRWAGDPPEGYTDIAGRLFKLTGMVSGKDAGKECLNLKGVQYVPDSQKLVKEVKKQKNIKTVERIGLGFNDVLEENRFDTADGYGLDTASFPWSLGQADNAGGGEDCGVSFGRKLNDFGCHIPVKQLCEYIGPRLNYTKGPVTKEDEAEGGALTWLTYDLGTRRQVSWVLYVAPDDADQMEVAQIRVGEEPDDRSDLQSTLCVHQTAKTVAGGFARRFKCAVPLVGRYLHVAQRPASPERYPRVAAFGILLP